ncbi:hypothetical protein M3484_05980 [Pseudomonas sp. GX19020]|uniref:hypothetical protein n=1 Tax=Pseudomonas sp. GX19020 TaxID=2942277 RepID=UPI00201917E6|nr:hypothetical protein [Pseudomonas sp. GX19020]MCL4066112.1 hypothetical protein [Pseudomonas sp. GX19020]
MQAQSSGADVPFGHPFDRPRNRTGPFADRRFYWDRNDKTRAFGERFAELNNGRKPTMNQAGAYSATLAYPEAVTVVGSPEDGACPLIAP